MGEAGAVRCDMALNRPHTIYTGEGDGCIQHMAGGLNVAPT